MFVIYLFFFFTVSEDDERLEEIWTGERLLLESHSGRGGPLSVDFRSLLHRQIARIQNCITSLDRFSGNLHLFSRFLLSFCRNQRAAMEMMK